MVVEESVARTKREDRTHASDRSARPASSPDVSIAIVHYETPADLVRCLASVRAAATEVSAEVFVIDNASTGFAPSIVTDLLPGAKVIRNSHNRGFARAANQALRTAKGRYLLLLNPDTVLAPDTLRKMLSYMDANPGVGCATPRLVLPDGRLDLACRRAFPTPMRSFYRLILLSRLFPRSRRFAQYNLTYLDEHHEAEIDAPCGAFMMVRAGVRDGVGLLDERYFMYGEDLDWAYRIKQAGWRIMYTPITTVTHVKRASSRHRRPATIKAFYEAMRIFYRNYYEKHHIRPVTWLTYTGINLRELLELTSARIGNRGARA
jgi:GT2 family glycosyltransferase